MNENIITQAIKDRKVLEFIYKDELRIVEPYVVGKTSKNKFTLLSIQIGGHTSSGTLPDWRMFEINNIHNIKIREREFSTHFHANTAGFEKQCGNNVLIDISKALNINEEFSTCLYNKLNDLKKINEDKTIYWLARDIQVFFGYKSWKNFSKIRKAAENTCKAKSQNPAKHFAYSRTSNIKDIILSQHACHLIAQKADARKDNVIFARIFFGIYKP